MAALVSVVGESLLVKRGGDMVTVSTQEAVGSAKFVALYFSAHWCPPCRGFTPVFAESYKAQGDDKEVQVIFISSDEDEKSFKGYYAEQPWAALPFASEALRSSAGAKFGVRGIPAVIVLNAATGAIVSKDGRSVVAAAPGKTLKGLFH